MINIPELLKQQAPATFQMSTTKIHHYPKKKSNVIPKRYEKKMTLNESKWAVHYLGCASVWQSIVTSVPLGAPTSWLGTTKIQYLYYINTHT